MKKIIIALLSIMVVVSGCGSNEVKSQEPAENAPVQEENVEASESTEEATDSTEEAPADSQEEITYEFAVETTEVESRGVKIPVTVVLPKGEEGEKFPFVAMAHGHGGMRDVFGAYTRVSEELAKKGIASIRMDFSGCGESKESFKDNNVTNMLADVTSSIEYMKSLDTIDGEKVGMLGYSMGGRIAMLSSENHSFSAMTLWAPAGTNGSDPMIAFLDGQESYDNLKCEAEKNGSVMFTTRFGQEQELGNQFFVDMEGTNPLEVIANYEGPMLVINGSVDDIVEPRIPAAVAEGAVKASKVATIEIEGASHGLGIYSQNPDFTNVLEGETVNFMVENLK